MSPTIPIDPSDPLVAFFALGLMEALKRVLKPAALARIGPIIPVIVVILALAMRVGYDASGGQLAWSSVLRGLAAAGVAVMTHTQFRSVAKAVVEAKAANDVQDPPQG